MKQLFQKLFKVAKKAAEESVPFDVEKVLEIAHENHKKEQGIKKTKKSRKRVYLEKKKEAAKRREERKQEMKKNKKLAMNPLIKKDKSEVSNTNENAVKSEQRVDKAEKNEEISEVLKEVKEVKEVKLIEINDFVPPEGIPKRSAWKSWRKKIDDEYLCKGKSIIIKKADGTTEVLTPKDALEKQKEKEEEKKALVKAIADKVEKKKKKREALQKKLDSIKHIDDPEEDFEHFIEIAVSCSWYQKRLTWMLSSVLNQKGDVPKILFNVAYPKNNGDPTTEKVCEFFREKGLDIKETVYNDFSIIQYRGFVRNRQLIESKSKWMLFADCDMAYSPYFFEDLAKQLRTKYVKESRCLSARRVSLDKNHCKDYFNGDPSSNYPRVVTEKEISDLASWPIFRNSSSVGAGYFQLFNVRTHRANTDGLYVDPHKNPDSPEHDAYHKTYSDKTFRKSINGVVRIQAKPQYHLNHERDNETKGKKHITIQR